MCDNVELSEKEEDRMQATHKKEEQIGGQTIKDPIGSHLRVQNWR